MLGAQVIVVSPHLDDAVLSCGQALAAQPGSTIVTVFAGIPDSDLPVTDFDVRSGFTSARQAVTERRAEDDRACNILAATPIHLDYFDRQYGHGNNPDAISESLLGVLAEFDGHDALIPLGLVHPDHTQVSTLAGQAAHKIGLRVFLYEELPARVLYPQSVPRADMTDLVPQGPLHLKEAAVACYRSQHWALDLHACLVPERYRCA
jgi:LmbE family N-acetylglucosaminyl deacetylase